MTEAIKINIEIPLSMRWTCEGYKQVIDKAVSEAVIAITNIQNNDKEAYKKFYEESISK